MSTLLLFLVYCCAWLSGSITECTSSLDYLQLRNNDLFWSARYRSFEVRVAIDRGFAGELPAYHGSELGAWGTILCVNPLLWFLATKATETLDPGWAPGPVLGLQVLFTHVKLSVTSMGKLQYFPRLVFRSQPSRNLVWGVILLTRGFIRGVSCEDDRFEGIGPGRWTSG